ncbi:MAG: hypothetical protein GWN71_45025, partial [Gammaproteobacteria bacterium]|nr:hypothetical protein [Gemmatimonadota bacterium]NIU80449.1 hypothetical protein [Gammaproteobacteria bacterium]
MRGSRLPRIVAWLARRTLLAYPPVFRRRMGAEVVSLVEELVAERRAESGRGRAVLLAVRLLGAMVRDAVLEWVSTATRRRPDLLSAPAAMRGDIGYGLRKLTRRPGLAVAAIASIGLAIGANSILFSAVDALLLEG